MIYGPVARDEKFVPQAQVDRVWLNLKLVERWVELSRSDWIAFSMSVRVIIAIGNWNCTDFPEIKKEPQSVEGRAVVWRRELNAWRKYAVFPSTFVKIAYYAINDGRDDL